MTLSKGHKWATYGMVATSFLSVATSNEIYSLVIVLAGLGLLVSYVWEPPRIQFAEWTSRWTTLSIVVFVAALVQLLLGAEMLLTGTSFLIYLLVVKCFQRQAPKDYLQLYALTFLMLVAGTVLQAELSYGILFFFYALFATWALSLFHLKRSAEETYGLPGTAVESPKVSQILGSRTLVPKRYYLGTGALSLVVFIVASIIFLAIPRIGFGFFFKNARSETTMAGFSDGVTLGGHGTIKSDDRVVLRVKVDPSVVDKAAPDFHWRGVAFDRYKNGQWSRSKQAPKTRRSVDYDGRSTTHHLLYQKPIRPKSTLRNERKQALKQELYLEPMGYDVLFGASMPIAFEFESKFKEKTRVGQSDEIRHPHAQGLKYVVYSDLSPPSEERLRASKGDIPSELAPYLDMPEEITERTIELAKELSADQRNPYDKAKVIEQWLKSDFDYTLEMEEPGDLEPIDFFLFERRRGHCEYFASSLAIMARAIGIPSRSVNGFLGGSWNEFDNYIAVRAGDAHSWVELYFADVGWITFDPTPSSNINPLQNRSLGLMDRMKRWSDSMRFAWFRWVIEYDLYRQLRFIKDIQKRFSGKSKDKAKNASSSSKTTTTSNRRAWAIGLGAFLTLVAIVFTAIRLRRRGDSPKAAQSAITKRYLKLSKRLGKKGYPRREGVTPLEHAKSLAEQRLKGSKQLVEFVGHYNAVHYGQRALDLSRIQILENEISRTLLSNR